MPTLQEILQDQNYLNANPATKKAIFDRWSASDTNYTGANSATQQAIRGRFGVGVEEPVAPPVSTERTVGEAFKDVGAGLVSGAGSLVQLPGQLYGLATGNFSKTGALGLGEDIAKYGEEMKSAGLKAREAERAAKVQEAEKTGQFAAFKAGFGETITDPALFTSFIAEQVPNILPMILTGGATAALTAGRASAAALAKGATKEAAAAAGKSAGAKAGTNAALGTNAVMQGADIGAGSYDEIYGELRAKGMSEEQAAAETINKARAAGVGAFAISLLASRLPGGKALEEILAGKKITGSRIGSGAVTALKEIPSENIEEVGGRVAQNVAARQAGLDRELLAGTGEAAAMATLGAAGIGGAAGALAPRRSESEQAAKEVDAFKQEEEEFRKQFGKAEPVEVKEPELPTEFPGGYTATRRELSRQDVPESYGIFAKGSDSPLTTVSTQEEADKKLQTLTEIRQQEQERLMAEGDNLMKPIEKARRDLEVMEATGRANTDEYVQARALLTQQEQEADNKFAEIFASINNYAQPLTLAPVGTRTDVQSDYVVKRGDQEIGAFPTLQDAETRLREIEPETFKQVEQQARVKTDDRVQQLKQTLTPMLAKFGLQDVGLNVVEKIENDAGGSYLDRLINISLTEDNPIQTMRHEAMHALKDLQFFTPQQYKALEERANKEWIKTYLADVPTELNGVQMSRLDAYKQLGLTQEEIVEEAISDAFGAYDKGATPPPGMIAALFKKLKNFFANFGQALRGAGFESADDVFQRVERGELKSRKPKAEAKAEPKEKPSAQSKSSLKKTKLVPLDLIAGPNASSYVPEYLTPLKEALAKGNTKLISLKDGTKVHLASGQDINGKDKFAVIALNEQGNEVGRLSFYENKDGSLDNINVGVAEKFRRKGLAMALYDAAEEMGFVFPSAEDKSWRTEEGQAFREARAKYKATPKDIKQADKYEEENGIRPYTPEGPFDVPTTAPKYSLQKFDPEKHASFDSTLGVPINSNGTVTVYYHTTKEKAVKIAQSKVIPSDGRSRIYLTNESGGAAVLRDKGNFDQEFDGSTVLVYVTPDMLQVDAEYSNGRRDFFIPLTEGNFFNKKMKMQSIQKGRDEAITGEFSYSDHEERITKAVEAYKDASAAERRAMLAQARKTLKSEHNVGSLLTENGKLEKTRIGDYGLEYEGNSVASQGLGLAAAQKITEKVSTCPRSAICEGLCLGETSGNNFLFGGAASEDVGEIKKSSFRAAARMTQYLKTEALIINPEAFAVLLQAEIDSLKKWSASPTQVKIDKETKKRLNVEKEIYQPAVRLNVTSDFKPEMFRAIIEGNPDVQFYDYTKLGNEPLSDNHHLTYSSTGFGQIVNGEKVFFKTKTGQYDHNWATMRKRLNNGQNVAMAFSSKSALPKSLLDEETRTEYRIWDGDDYDARFLDPKQPDGKGMIIGLRNKAGNLSEKNATERTGGFFVQYNPKTDGDTVFVPDQAQFKDGGRKVIPLTKEKFSLRAPVSPAFKQWFGDSKIVDADGKPKVMYHGLAKDTTDFTRKTERGAPIFLTDDPKFADRFATDSYLQVADHPEKYLTKAQLGEGEKRAISFIRKDYGKDTLGKEMIASIRDGSPTAEAREYLQKEYVTMLPTGPHVMPLYVRAENPFDYENPRHIRKVLDELGESAYDPAEIRSGSWESIEGADFQEAIQFAGFDSFYVKEHGRKNLAVYQPNQVKSATGNVGTFSRESDDVRYSLKNVAFPSAEEAKKAVAKTSVPKTDEFKLFIAGNQWVDEDGDQKVFYHGTASEFFEFTPAGKASAIYLADTPEEAEAFGKIAEDRLRQQVYRALTKDEKVDFFQSIVDAKVENESMTEKEGADFMRQVKRKAPEFGSFGDLERETRAALIDLSPTRSAIMPLYARAETPFDFRNPDHVAQIAQVVRRPNAKLSEEFKQEAREMGAPTEYPEHWYRGLPGLLKQGYSSIIEQEPVQIAIRRLGFDGYVSRRNRTSPIVYAVYSPEQVKSATGNLGEFSRESKDMRYSLKKVRYSPDRFQKLWDESMYTQNDAENKTKGYLAFVNPMEFVRALASPDTFDRLRREQEPIDFEKMRAYGGIPSLTVSEKNGNWKITGHEGRHRMLALYDDGYREVPVYIHLRSEDAKSIPSKALTAQYDDALSSVLMVAEVEPLSYANKQKALEKFTRMESRVKYSLPTIPQQITDRMDESTFKRQKQGFVERMIEAISPKSAAHFRAANINRYNQMSVLDKKRAEQMGGAVLLADQSAESAALMSDLSAGVAASAMGVGDRNGGIPVLRNGITTIDTSVKGMVASLAPLAAYGDPVVYQRYQYWAMVKRGQRLNAKGILTGIDSADVAFAKVLLQAHPEFVDVQKDLVAFNDGLVKYMVDTGVLSKERGYEYTKHADYVPFYRQMDGGEKTLGPNLFQSLSGVRPPPKLKGKDVAEAPLADFLETMVRNTQSAIQAGMKNYAAQRTIDAALQVQAPGMDMERLPVVSTAPDVVSVLEKGKLVSYRTADSLLIDAMKSLNLSELPFMTMLSAPADLLRNLVTKDPGFMLANLMRDSMSAWVTSGQKMTPIAGTVINFGKALTRNSPGFEAMLNAGIIGGYEFNANIEQSGFKLEEDLKRKAGKRDDSILLRPFKSVWDALETGTTASDAATRALIYERVLADTGNEAEALYRSLEVMNFHRKGSSPLVRVLTATVPFFNARLQGLDLFYRASTGNMNTNDAAAIKRKFWARGATMFMLSGIYWMLVSDDEEYKKQEQETRDNNWLIPSLGIRIPIPFEVGVLFKVVPERIAAYSFGDDTGKDLRESAMRSLVSTFAFNPTPQIVKPIAEAVVDFNPFTWRSIVSKGMEDVEAKYQVSPSTSEFSKMIAQSLGLSPVKVDHILKGYSGTIGMYGIDTIDILLEQFGDSPKATKRFEQLPVIKRFALDAEARGYVTQYYELKDAVDTTVRTMNLLEKTGESKEYVEYLTKNQGTLAFKDYIRDTEKMMKDLREMRLAIRSSQMTGDEKRDSLLEISKMESAITSGIQDIKKAIAKAQ